MLGMIIGVAAVIAMVAMGSGAQHMIEEQIKSAGTNMITIMPGSFNQGGVRGGGGTSTRLVPEDAEALRELPELEFVSEVVNTRTQLIYQQPELADEHPGRERRPAAHPLVAHAVRRVLQPGGRQDRGQGDRARRERVRQPLRRGRRPDRHDDPRPQSDLPRARRDGLQGRLLGRHEPGRPGLRAVHHGDEEAVRPAEPEQYRRLGLLGRHDQRRRRRGQEPDASAARNRRQARTTTSPSRRSRTSSRCAPSRPRR